jgi:hypothetical protein
MGDSLAGRAEAIELMPLSQGGLARLRRPRAHIRGGAAPTRTARANRKG